MEKSPCVITEEAFLIVYANEKHAGKDNGVSKRKWKRTEQKCIEVYCRDFYGGG